MIDLAVHILHGKAEHFDLTKFKDEYETALKTLVKRKAAEKPEKADNIINLTDELKASLKGGIAPSKRASALRPHFARSDSQESTSLIGACAQGELSTCGLSGYPLVLSSNSPIFLPPMPNPTTHFFGLSSAH